MYTNNMLNSQEKLSIILYYRQILHPDAYFQRFGRLYFSFIYLAFKKINKFINLLRNILNTSLNLIKVVVFEIYRSASPWVVLS